jgi:hypothetical protein
LARGSDNSKWLCTSVGWFTARMIFYPEDGGDTFLQNGAVSQKMTLLVRPLSHDIDVLFSNILIRDCNKLELKYNCFCAMLIKNHTFLTHEECFTYPETCIYKTIQEAFIVGLV